MLVEERIYTLKPECIDTFLQLYEQEGLPIQSRILPRMLGYFVTETGTLHQVVHLWAYQSFEERAAKRAQMYADPDWQKYLVKVRPLFVKQESRLLRPLPWSPIR